MGSLGIPMLGLWIVGWPSSTHSRSSELYLIFQSLYKSASECTHWHSESGISLTDVAAPHTPVSLGKARSMRFAFCPA